MGFIAASIPSESALTVTSSTDEVSFTVELDSVVSLLGVDSNYIDYSITAEITDANIESAMISLN